MRFGSVLLALLVVLVPVELAAEPKAQKPPPWQKFDEEDGISVYRRDMPNSPIVALRGEGLIHAPILRVASVIIDSSRAPEWVDSLAAVKILRKVGDTERVEWNQVSTPFPLADRDFVIHSKLEIKAATKQLLFSSHSVQDKAAPKTDYVRGHIHYANFILTSVGQGKSTRMLAEVQADPKGSVPKWLVNLFQKGWPHNTFMSLRKQVAKTDIKDDPKLKQAMIDAGFKL